MPSNSMHKTVLSHSSGPISNNRQSLPIDGYASTYKLARAAIRPCNPEHERERHKRMFVTKQIRRAAIAALAAAANGPVQLNRNEQIAYMFLSAIEVIEHECQLDIQRACPLDQLLSGAYPKGGIDHLKFDPNKADPSYTYTLAVNGMAWEAHATAKKPGLKGFCFMSRDIGTTIVTYSNSGPAGWTSTAVGNRGTEGDSFATQ
jgi:hypothetical protein